MNLPLLFCKTVYIRYLNIWGTFVSLCGGEQSSEAISYRCRKTAVCNGDQLLDFSVPELVRSQSTFSTDPEVLQNCAGFTLCSPAGLAVGECSVVMGLQIYCVLRVSAEF